MIKRRYLFVAITLLSVSSLFSQDIHFSQYFYSMLNLNPAYTGNFEGAWRVNANNRNQWSVLPQPYNTSSIYFDAPVYIGDTRINMGGGIVHDESGGLYLTANKLAFSFSYAKILKSQHIFRFGAQLGYTFKNTDSGEMTMPNQYDRIPGNFNSELSNGEISNNTSSYLDINVGAIWEKRFNWGKPEVGLSMYHVNFPKENFYSSNEVLTPRTVFHAAIEKSINEKIVIVPRTLFMYHASAINFNLGAEARLNIEINNTKNNHIFFGTYLRNNLSKKSDAVIFNTGMKYGNILFGISYDVNISELNTVTNYNGAIEFALIYTLDYEKYNKYTVPCERY